MSTECQKCLAWRCQFAWKGDLTDDCCLRIGWLCAHAELMCDDIKCRADGEKWTEERWFLGVYISDPTAETGKDDVTLFHSGEHAGAITTGEMARAIAEAIIRAVNTASGSLNFTDTRDVKHYASPSPSVGRNEVEGTAPKRVQVNASPTTGETVARRTGASREIGRDSRRDGTFSENAKLSSKEAE